MHETLRFTKQGQCAKTQLFIGNFTFFGHIYPFRETIHFMVARF